MKRKDPVDPRRAAYRRALSTAVLRHARYLAIRDDKRATKHLVERRREQWLLMERQKSGLEAGASAADLVEGRNEC